MTCQVGELIYSTVSLWSYNPIYFAQFSFTVVLAYQRRRKKLEEARNNQVWLLLPLIWIQLVSLIPIDFLTLHTQSLAFTPYALNYNYSCSSLPVWAV